MTVTDLQQGFESNRPDDEVIAAPAVIRRLLQEIGRSPWKITQDDVETDPINLNSLRLAGKHFSEGDTKRLLRLIPDEATRSEYAFRFQRAELLRIAQRLGPDSFKLVTSRALLNEVGRGQSERTGGKAEYWTIKLLQLQLSFGDEPRIATCGSLRPQHEKYVARVRIDCGERLAFKNAVVLMNAYLGTRPFDTTVQRHALLGISYIAIDLAAQLNDYWSLRKLANTLARTGHEGFTADERLLLQRLVLDARSRADRYSPEFDYQSKVRKEAGDLAEAAVEPAEKALRTIGELAFSWPELTVAWVGSYFGLLNHGINVGWAPGRLTEMFKRHDELISAIAPISPGATLLSEATKRGAKDPYTAEFLATLAMVRKSPSHNLRPKGQSYKSNFDIERALAITGSALTSIDPKNHYGDTIVGGLQLARAEAFLCKGGRGIKGTLREEYAAARSEASAAFCRLGMERKLLRLDKLELRAGIIRSGNA